MDLIGPRWLSALSIRIIRTLPLSQVFIFLLSKVQKPLGEVYPFSFVLTPFTREFTFLPFLNVNLFIHLFGYLGELIDLFVLLPCLLVGC